VLTAIHLVLTLLMGGGVVLGGATYAGLAGIVGPMLCFFAASGLKGSLMVGTPTQKFGGLGAALVFAAVGLGIVYHSGYGVVLFGYELSGIAWCLVGFVAGWISTTRRHATA